MPLSRPSRWLCWLACLALGCGAAPAGPPEPPRERPSEVEARIARVTRDLRSAAAPAKPATLGERMLRLGSPGLSVAVIEDARIEWARGFGVRESGTDDPVDAATVFQAGTLSQPLFALAVLRMVEAGRLDLDADVNTGLSSWRIPPVGGWQPAITLRQLLTHSAALGETDLSGYRRGAPLPSAVQLLEGAPPARGAPVRAHGIPGLAARPSSGGLLVAQVLVGDVLHQPFAGLMHDWLLSPLEMRDSTFAQPLLDDGRLVPAAGHAPGAEVLPGKYRVYPQAAAAGLWTTPTDLAKAALAIRHSALGNDDGPLPTRWLREILAPHAIHPATGAPPPPWILRGEATGYRAELVVYEQLGKGAVVMINSDASALIAELMASIAREYAWPGFPPPPRAPVELPPRALRALAGTYRTRAGARFELVVRDGALALEAEGQPPLALSALSATELLAHELGLELRFHLAPGGRIERLTLEQPGAPPVVAQPERRKR